ncbi:Putative transcription regulator, LysR family [Cupriavidus taiwanensis]|uniref:Transcription regulator, LysR family n=1 Tax=Cupriavidus taiwanensis TaxID=164546 RepID=A0A976AZF4_9BURK|nr:LysR family transcriptional regulator [Cupriavidus taiwanensis]SOZ17298.1 Putative transcription regulator, LysR family [Cupriavidus taiwanensis]SOZ29640.1 Putative transcription regulator, LysR family [Cupriavidus taiwanensis]SOZ46860.1 Putative transcription regulator, LysR family [Cupriavidus taiwanensis]SOZ62134.1 Putative transcription regulator, LysR family [Cupriavidus taiwanensis]SOZ62325.1 Putative transcription regulator, LysR family [Cupriavidus taiwanensis]
MNIAGKDLNLLYVFHVLYQEGNASRAAARMALSQPALSHKLNRLRDELGDPLFVRAPRGLTPTPRAHALAPQVQRLVADLDAFYDACDGRDFLARSEAVHIYTTDYMEQLLLPALLPRLRRDAPGVVLVTHNTRGELPREELEKGTCDLAIAGFYENLPDTFHQQRLGSEDFVVLASRTNRRIAHGMDLDAFLACEHLLTTLTGDLNGVVDRALARLGHRRTVVAGLSSFLAPSRLVRGSALLLTCLRSVAQEAVARDPDLVMLPVPFALPRVDMMQIWHARTDADRLRRWLRQQIQEAASVLGAVSPATPATPATRRPRVRRG